MDFYSMSSDDVVWVIKRAFAKRRWFDRVKCICRVEQIILGTITVLLPVFIFAFLYYFKGNFNYFYPTCFICLWGFYLLGTKRNYLFEMWLSDRK